MLEAGGSGGTLPLGGGWSPTHAFLYGKKEFQWWAEGLITAVAMAVADGEDGDKLDGGWC